MADYTYVIMFKDKGRWEKAIAHGQEEKEIIFCVHADDNPFIKRFCLIGRGVKTPFDSEQEANASKQEGDMVQVMAPPINFSEKSEDVEFYYQDEIPEEEAMPLGDGEDAPEK